MKLNCANFNIHTYGILIICYYHTITLRQTDLENYLPYSEAATQCSLRHSQHNPLRHCHACGNKRWWLW